MINRIVIAGCVSVLCAVGAVNGVEMSGSYSDARDRKLEAEARAVEAAKVKATDATYVGCLRAEADGKKFVLTEVGGPNAPRQRSWKTAFVTKRPGKLSVVTAEPRLRLRDHVGRTVQVSGRRQDKELRVRTIKVIGATCS